MLRLIAALRYDRQIMEELARFEDIIEGVEAKFAQMAEFCIGTVRGALRGGFGKTGIGRISIYRIL